QRYHVYYTTSVHSFVHQTATTQIYTLSLHDALPISAQGSARGVARAPRAPLPHRAPRGDRRQRPRGRRARRGQPGDLLPLAPEARPQAAPRGRLAGLAWLVDSLWRGSLEVRPCAPPLRIRSSNEPCASPIA